MYKRLRFPPCLPQRAGRIKLSTLKSTSRMRSLWRKTLYPLQCSNSRAQNNKGMENRCEWRYTAPDKCNTDWMIHKWAGAPSYRLLRHRVKTGMLGSAWWGFTAGRDIQRRMEALHHKFISFKIWEERKNIHFLKWITLSFMWSFFALRELRCIS